MRGNDVLQDAKLLLSIAIPALIRYTESSILIGDYDNDTAL